MKLDNTHFVNKIIFNKIMLHLLLGGFMLNRKQLKRAENREKTYGKRYHDDPNHAPCPSAVQFPQALFKDKEKAKSPKK